MLASSRTQVQPYAQFVDQEPREAAADVVLVLRMFNPTGEGAQGTRTGRIVTRSISELLIDTLRPTVRALAVGRKSVRSVLGNSGVDALVPEQLRVSLASLRPRAPSTVEPAEPT